MSFTRRSFLVATGAALTAGSFHGAAFAAGAPDTRFTPRVLGNPDAKVVVEEWFSLTCIHCAHFAEQTFPQVRKNLIDTGKIRYVFHDFPTDQLATLAAMVARTLPEERYEPFCSAVLSSLDRWAYNNEADHKAELQKMAAFAGMPAETFEKAVTDQNLLQFIMSEQSQAQDKYNIESTPTFRFNNKEQVSSALSYDDFVKYLTKAS
ncbi:thioredoxin domain-containing protein [Acetobacter ghanensis]|uniref:Thioredoxin domain-containing protein n=2 Tax=Acetobacter ghanensis TaxID=431306 RepID=A0ABX0KFI6_9PROT|nr:thioredoxin domain-containing protein [Acetobacter ghanensis]NHO38320.1 thioredoxin domain-containing protein [Acetobacter ghanensis]GBQ50870.1 thiol:disulfide interchange protein [Acetobacter ghanensis DSM 18895]